MDVNEELKFFVKIQKKKNWGVGGGVVGLGGGGGVRVDVIEELKFLGNFTKNQFRGGRGGVGSVRGGGGGGGGGGGVAVRVGGVRVDV